MNSTQYGLYICPEYIMITDIMNLLDELQIENSIKNKLIDDSIASNLVLVDVNNLEDINKKRNICMKHNVACFYREVGCEGMKIE